MLNKRKFVSVAAVAAMSGGIVGIPMVANAAMVGFEGATYNEVHNFKNTGQLTSSTNIYGYEDNNNDGNPNVGDTLKIRTTISDDSAVNDEYYDLSISSRENNMKRVPVPGSFGAGDEANIVYESTMPLTQDVFDGMPVWYFVNYKNKYGVESASDNGPLSFVAIGGELRTLPKMTSGILQMDTSVIKDNESGKLIQTYIADTTLEKNWDSANQTNSVDPTLKADKVYDNTYSQEARRLTVGDTQYVALKIRNMSTSNWTNISVRVPFEDVVSSTCTGLNVDINQTVSCNVGLKVVQDSLDWKHASDGRGGSEGVGAGISPIVTYTDDTGTKATGFITNNRSNSLPDGSYRTIFDNSVVVVPTPFVDVDKTPVNPYLGDTITWQYKLDYPKITDLNTGDLVSTTGKSYNEQQVLSDNFGYAVNKESVNSTTVFAKKTCKVVDGDKCYNTVNESAQFLAYAPYLGNQSLTSYDMGQSVPQNTIVDPNNPLIVDKPGWKNDSVTAPANTDGVTYSLDYNQQAGTYTMKANAAYLYAFDSAGTREFVKTGQLNVSPVVVTSEGPKITDNPGYANDSVVAPADTDQITYQLDYDKVSGKWTQTATAAEGYAFSNGTNTWVITGQLGSTNADVQAPTIVDNPSWINDSVTAPDDTAEIDYSLDYNQKTGEYTMTATPKEGYTLQSGEAQDVFTGKLKVDPIVVEAAKPVITDNPGTADDSVKAPDNTDQIAYVIDYDKATGKWTLTATAAEGYAFAGGETTNVQSGTLDTTVPTSEPTVVTPAKPVIVDKPGYVDDTVTAPDNTAQIKYDLTYDQKTGKWSLTATAQNGFVFADGKTTNVQTGTLDIVVPVPQPTVVTPEKPVIVDKPGYLNDAVKAPSDTAQIKYDLTYDQKTGKWSLTATAQNGFVFADGKTTNVQTGTLDIVVPTPDPVVVTPEKPVITDKPGYLNDTVKAPSDTAQIKYNLTYDQKTGKWSLTATAQNGFVFADGKTTNVQTGTLDAKPVVVKAAAPVVVDKAGWKNDDVIAPKDTNQVSYALDYDQEAGEWVLTATAAEGYAFADGSTTNVQTGELDVFVAPIPEIIQTGMVSDDTVPASGVWGLLGMVLAGLLGVAGYNKIRTNK